MATYRVEDDHNSIEPWQMTAGQTDEVRFSDPVDRIEITSDGSAEVRVTNGGADPTFEEPGTSTRSFRLPAGVMATRDIPMPQADDVLKLKSSGTPVVSVQIVR